uniref:Uncharacterized protein n=1 Tax=Anguilla anguilla TaxID=7936 RepID=A0A0E9V088_ANGAN
MLTLKNIYLTIVYPPMHFTCCSNKKREILQLS